MSSKKKGKPETVGDLNVGDIVIVGEDTYRLMMRAFDAWGCRKQLPNGEWSTDYTWHLFTQKITRVVKLMAANSKSSIEASFDPLNKR
jgi:hypothetical protein